MFYNVVRREAPKVRLKGRASLLRVPSLQLDIGGKLYLAPLTTVGPTWGGLGGGSVVTPTVPSVCWSWGWGGCLGSLPVPPSNVCVPAVPSVGTCPSGGSVNALGPM